MEFPKRIRIFILGTILVGLTAFTFLEKPDVNGEMSRDELDSAELAALDVRVKKLAFRYPDSSLMLGRPGLTQSIQSRDSALASSFWLNMGVAYYAQGSFDSAIYFYNQSTVFSDGTPEKFTMPLAMNNMAVIFQRIGKVDTAIRIYKNVYKIYEARKDTLRQGRCLFNLGRAHLIIGKDSAGLNFIEQSIKIYDQLGRRSFKNLANAYNEMATIRYNDGEYLAALEDYQRSISYYEEAGDTLKALMPKGNIGNIHMDLKDYVKAAEIFEEIIEIKNEHNLYTVHFNYHNLGNAYDKLGLDELAVTNLHKALELREKSGALGHSTATAVKLGDFYQRRRFADSAGHYYTKAYELSLSIDNQEYRLQALCAYGEWMLSQGKRKEAGELLKEAYETARILNYRPLLARASKGLQEVYAFEGNYPLAYEYLQRASKLEDSLFNAELVRETALLESGFRYEKELIQKQNEIEGLESKEELANLRMILLISGIILTILIATFITRSQIRKKHQILMINRFKEAMTGMIAHDLKNPLSIILNNRDVDKNQHTAKQMLQLINNMLDVQKFEAARMALDLQQVSLEALVSDAIGQVELLAKQSNIEIRKEVLSVATEADKQILERVLVNLLTNAIKFSPNNGVINILAKENDGSVTLSISDQGKGIPKEDQALIFETFGQLDPRMSGGVGSTGLGLTFCKLAIEAHDSKLELTSTPNEGTTFWFDLPIATLEEGMVESQGQPKYLTMGTIDQEIIAASIPALKQLNLYQIGEIEKELAAINKGENESVDQWVEAILDAAYAGNQEAYDALLDKIQMTS